MGQGVISLLIVTVVTAGGGAVNAQSGSPKVRPEGDTVRELIDRGMERSATFRGLISALDPTDVIVYIRFSACSGGVPACLLWASVSADTRRLVIKIDRFGRSPDELTALLAHELQHANEVALATLITDPESFQKSFASGGWKHSGGFETEEAAKITLTVTAELSAYERPTAIRRRPR